MSTIPFGSWCDAATAFDVYDLDCGEMDPRLREDDGRGVERSSIYRHPREGEDPFHHFDRSRPFHPDRRMEKQYFVYVLTSGPRGTLYIGVTSDLPKRIGEHRTKAVDGFTKRYDIAHLVWFEPHATAESAIVREKQLKHWNRAWKIRLIEETNPRWHDLYEGLLR